MNEGNACGSKELERPLSRFPLRGKAGAGGFPPSRQHAARPAKSAGTHRAPALPTRGLPPPCGSPASAVRRAWQLETTARLGHTRRPIGLRWRTVYTKYLTLPEGLQAPKLITRHYYTGTRAPRPAAWRKSEVVSANHFLYRLDGIPFQTIVHMNVGFVLVLAPLLSDPLELAARTGIPPGSPCKARTCPPLVDKVGRAAGAP